MAKKQKTIKIDDDLKGAMELVDQLIIKAEEKGLNMISLIEIMMFRSIFAAFSFGMIEGSPVHDWLFDTVNHYLEEAERLIEESKNEKR